MIDLDKYKLFVVIMKYVENSICYVLFSYLSILHQIGIKCHITKKYKKLDLDQVVNLPFQSKTPVAMEMI